MSALSAADAIDLWERGDGLDALGRSLALAAAAGAPDDVASLPVGERDRCVLRLRTGLFGETLAATAACPACAEQVEFAVDAEALLAREPAPAAPLHLDGVIVLWRPPDSVDLAAAAAAGDSEEAERVLLGRCVECSIEPLPPAAREAVAAAMSAADPLAEVLVDLACPACDASFVVDLELGDFVWREVRARAERLLREVDVLAREYGWPEREVLSLSDGRRAFYLGLARGDAR